jgi:transposase
MEGIGIVRRNLFWLSDEQWKRIEPHLPTDVRAIERTDDRRVISGIVHVLNRSQNQKCQAAPIKTGKQLSTLHSMSWSARRRKGLRNRQPKRLGGP